MGIFVEFPWILLPSWPPLSSLARTLMLYYVECDIKKLKLLAFTFLMLKQAKN